MDVRLFNFLARQPSARLAPRDRFCGLPKRGIALILANALFWQPIWAQAEGIAVSGGTQTSLGQAGNGVPIVNIAAPNASGLSHNQYQQYNVGQEGVILNNATGRTQSTQLGGIIVGNPNLNGTAAGTILNEVVGANASQLKGYTEVAGQAARVIVANPYGVTCDGCGFINTPRATLTTGKPVLDSGRLDHFQVDGGQVTVEGQGLDASTVDQFEIITRAAQINGQINARQLAVVAGRNKVDAQTLTPTALADDGSAKPSVAIDSSALGGMYAGAIKLVGTEAGVGVKLAGNLAASAGDIQIDANGQLTLAQTAASGAVNVKAGSLDASGPVYGTSVTASTTGDLANHGNLAARDSLRLESGGQLSNSGVIEAGVNADNSRNTTGDVAVTASSLRNTGSITASRALTAAVSQTLNNQGGTLHSQAGTQVTAGTLDNRQGGRVLSQAALGVRADQVLNGAGRIASQGDLTASVGSFEQQGGELVAQGSLALTGTRLDNRAGGLVGATKALKLDVERIDNRGGELSSQMGVALASQQLDNSDGGKVLAGAALELKAAQVINRNKGLLFGDTLHLDGQRLDNGQGTLAGQNGAVLALSEQLDNSAGVISSEAALSVNAGSVRNAAGSLSSAAALMLNATGAVDNQGGAITTDAALTLTSASLDNRNNGLISGKGATQVSTGALDNSHGGRLTSNDTLTLNAGQVTNQDAGRIASALALTANVTGLDQQGGQLFSKSALSLDLNNGVLNNQGGLINAPGALALNHLDTFNNQGGELSSNQGFTLAAQQFDNNGGKLLSDGRLTLRIAEVMNNLKGAVAANGLELTTDSLDSSDGLLSSRDDTTLVVHNGLINQRGTLIADGDLLLEAATLDNNQGQVSSKGNLTARVRQLQQQGGQLVAQGALSLTGESLDNRANSLIGATQGLTLDVTDVDNRGGELSSQGTIALTSQRLDNSDSGKVLAQQTLALTVDELTNRDNGLLSGKAGLSLNGGRLANTGGALASLAALNIDLADALDNTQGLLSSEGTLSVQAGSLVNTGGQVSSADALTLDTEGAMDNSGGRMVTDGTLAVRSASLLNRDQGTLSSKGALAVTTGDFDNSQAGRVSSGDRLTLTAAQLSNRDGGSIGSAQALVASVTGLDQRNGQLFSNAALTLDLNNGLLNNQGGLINAPGALLLQHLNEVQNQGGELSSAQAFTLAAQRLDNSGGKVLSNQGLTLRIAQALNNVKGLIAAASLEATAASVDNRSGTLTSRSDLQLTTDGLLNTGDNGLINSQGALSLTAGTLDTSNGGEVSSVDNMVLALGGLTQTGGRLVSDAGLSLDLQGADLNNRSGLINAKGPLMLERVGNVNNQGGELSSLQSFALATGMLDNSNGKLISNAQLGLTASNLINQNGLISGWQGIELTGSTLDNRNNGTLSARAGNLTARLSGALLNGNGGALVSQQALSVSSASLDNRGGILSSGAGQTLAIQGLLDNSQNGQIDSGAALTLSADALDNAVGNLSAQQALSFTGTTLDNSGGTFSSQGAVTLDLLGALTNTNGKLASAGPLQLVRSSQVVNQGGQLVSQRLMTLNTGSLDNRNRGTVAASDRLVIAASGDLLNSADGLIYSQNAAVQLNAARLANSQGAVQGQDALGISVGGDIDNLDGRLIAQGGDLAVTAASLDSRGGVLSSLQGAFTARITGVLKNGYDLNRQGGVIQAQRLDLLASAGLDNYGGRVSARGGDALVAANRFDNRNGGLYAKGLVRFTGDSFDNSGDNDGQIAGQQIDLNLSGALNNRFGIIESDTTLNITAASLNNQTGKIRALGTTGTTQFNIGGTFDNRNGTLETANNDLAFNVGNFLNTNGSLLHVGSGEFGISTASVTNAGGNIVTRGGLTLDADNWTNSSVIQAGRLTVNVGAFIQAASGQLLASNAFVGTGGNWTNDGLIASDGSLNLNLSGSYGGNGRVSSLGNLTLSAAQLNLTNAASIAGGGSTGINVGGQLTNQGRLTSAGDLTVSAGALNNYGTLGAGQGLAVNTPSLLNDHGLLFSGENIQLNVDSFTNQTGDLYGLRNVTIGGYGATRANQISNISGSMESGGQFSIAATAFENRTQGGGEGSNVTFERTLVSGSIEDQCVECSGGHVRVNYSTHEVFSGGLDTDTTASSLITAGINFSFSGSSFLNSKSSVSATGNITVQADNVKNLGATGGIIERTRVYYSDRIKFKTWHRFKPIVAQYNARNNVDGAQYDPSNLMALPEVFKSYALVSDVEIIKAGSGNGGRSAVIQAGGKVSISATQDLQNSVIHEDYAVGGGTNKVQDTRASGAGAPVVLRINGQLPPNLAQQQINPLSLPGFSLPTGQNGLFRLSGQGGSAVQAAQITGAPQSWGLAGASISLAQREQASPDALARDVQISGAAQLLVSAGQLATVHHQNAGITAVSTAILAGGNVLPGAGGAGPAAPVVAKAQGVPSSAARVSTNKYLIETNPALTDLKQFMSSDYLLGSLGYDPDASWKRLGDGLYEQRLVQQAITARTGQAFIDGQTSNEAQFKYLMNNAIASKEALNLTMGVSLTSEQVAALTHDIVWMEDAVVNGEHVLVPVVYLAQASGRLGPTGALIAGNDVSLIAGKNLDNVGTLKATNNLSASAGGDLVNSGLIQAGNRLDLLAGNSVVNKAGGIIAGRDVSVSAIVGDFTNERSKVSLDSSVQGTLHKDYADNAARIEAANDLTIAAGRDISNSGSVLQSGRDLTLNAGRDVNVASSQVSNSLYLDAKHNSSDITQTSSTVMAGRDLNIQAGRDINLIASQLDAKRDVAMTATENLAISSAADETHSLSKSKKVTRQEDHVSQVVTSVTAGGDLGLSAGQDLTVTASTLTAANEAYLVAGGKLGLLAAQDSDYSLYDKKKKGHFGAKKTKHDEVTQVTNVGSEVKTGGDLLLVSGGDQTYQAAKLDSGKNLSLNSGGAITFEGVKDLHQESHTKSSSSLAWTSAKGKGKTDETLQQSELVAKGALAINAVNGLHIDVKQVNQQTVSQAIDAMVKADPQLAWLKEAEKRGDVDWRQVAEIHDSFKYSQSGLGVGAQLAIAILVTYFTAGMASGFVASTAGATGATASTSAWAAATASASAGWANAAATAVITSAASGAAVSTINNRGNLGAVVKDITSADAMKGYVVGAVTAGLTAGLYDKWTSTQTATSTLSGSASGTGSTLLANSGKVAGSTLGTWSGIGQFAANQALQNVTSATVSKLLGMGGDFGDALRTSLANTFAAAGFNYVGNTGYIKKYAPGSPEMIGLHAVMGGLAAVAAGGDFKAGALAGGASEALVRTLDNQFAGLAPEKRSGLLVLSSQLVGVAAAAWVDNGDGKALQTGAWVAQNGTQYNYLSDHQQQVRDKELKDCKTPSECLNAGVKWSAIDLQQDIGLALGAAASAGISTKETAEGIVSLITNWSDTKAVFNQLYESDEFRQKVGTAILNDFKQRVDLMSQAYNDAGWDGSITAGVEAGKLAGDLLGLFVAAKGVVSITAKLPSAASKAVGSVSDAIASAKVPTKSVNAAEQAAKSGSGSPAWESNEGAYSEKFSGSYNPGTTTVNGQVVESAGDFGGGLGPKGADTSLGRGLAYDNPSNLIQSRVSEIQSQIPANSQGRITMGVAVVEDANGVRSVLVSTSEPRGYLRPGVSLQEGEKVIVGTGHAEADIVSYANANGLKIVDIGATRPVCASCQNLIEPTGANVSTPLKSLPKAKQ